MLLLRALGVKGRGGEGEIIEEGERTAWQLVVGDSFHFRKFVQTYDEDDDFGRNIGYLEYE